MAEIEETSRNHVDVDVDEDEEETFCDAAGEGENGDDHDVHMNDVSTTKEVKVLPPAPVETVDVDDDDDFGDFEANFTSAPVPATPPIPTPSTKVTETPFVRSTSADSDSTPVSMPSRESGVEGYQKLIQAVFKRSESICDDEGEDSHRTNRTIDSELSDNSPDIISWAHVQNFEDSHCLLFKWINSEVHQRLLKCLNITKTSVIMYSTKYGAVEVPKFATSLLDTPLQPQALNNSQSTLSPSHPQPPEPEFDNFQSASPSSGPSRLTPASDTMKCDTTSTAVSAESILS